MHMTSNLLERTWELPKRIIDRFSGLFWVPKSFSVDSILGAAVGSIPAQAHRTDRPLRWRLIVQNHFRVLGLSVFIVKTTRYLLL